MSLTSAYKSMTKSGDLRLDPAQVKALEILQDIKSALEGGTHGRALARLFRVPTGRTATGLYLWGGVGGGKSMLMDLLYDKIDIHQKRRVHFHAFMQEVHSTIYVTRQLPAEDPIAVVANGIIRQTRLLCLDEMQVGDITDAMIVGRLFKKLIEGGVTVVTTSNRPPRDLYKHGLNREIFLPFIELMNTQLTVHHLEGLVDYRQDKIRGQQTYFTPLNAATAIKIDRIWHAIAGDEAQPHTLHVKSRDVVLPLFHNGVARAEFADLCERPLGAADYLAIADTIRMLVLENIPTMNRENANAAKRFIILVDTLYEAKTRLICSAAAQPDDLFKDTKGRFEFARTASRLSEMRSTEWGL